MKKTYSKPEIMFEDFTLCTNIAAGCEVKTWTPSSGSCSYNIIDEFGDEYTVFVSDVAACGTTEGDKAYNGICYHVPLGENLFNS